MKGKPKTNKNQVSIPKDNKETHSILFWFMIGIAVIFLLWAPFQRALFNGFGVDFERSIFTTFIWGAILLSIISVYSFFNYKYRTMKDFLIIAVWLIPLSYLISIISAASGHFAVNMFYIHIVYAVFFILGVYVASNKLGNSILQNLIILSGYLIVLFGLLNWFGNLGLANQIAGIFTNLNNAPAYTHAVMFDSNGARLTAVFQYANTYAAYLMILLFAGLFLVVKSNKWHLTFLHGLMIVPILISFLLTLSRGALVVLPVVLLILLLFFNLHRQIMYILYLGLAGLASLLIIGEVTASGLELQNGFSAALSWKGWSLLLLASFIYSGVLVLLQLYVSPWLKAKLGKKLTWRFSSIVLPVSSVLLGTILGVLLLTDTGVTQLLPENIKQRIDNINFAQHSVLERGTFYKDSFKLWKDYPVFGSGGGGWAALYEQYQSNPYTSRQAHNFFLQYLVEVGLFGLLIFITFLAAVFVPYIRKYFNVNDESKDNRFLYLILIVSLLAHSAIDFNLSYVYLGLLLFLALGGLTSGLDKVRAPWTEKLAAKQKVLNISFSSTMTVISIIVLIISIRFLSANNLFYQALSETQQGKSYHEIVNTIDRGLEIQTGHPDYFELKYSVLTQVAQQANEQTLYEETNELFTEFSQKEPHHKFLYEVQVNNFINQRNFSGALSVNTKGVELFPWELTFYENRISILFELGNKAREENNKELTDQYWNEALEVYNAVIDKRKQLDALPEEQLEGRPFHVTNMMSLSIGQIHFLNHNYTEAEALFASGLTNQGEDSLKQVITRWYLASQIKLGKLDESLYDEFISSHSKEEEEINRLVNAVN